MITSLLISEWQRTETIRLGTFWARRARRLLPALLVMVAGVAVMAAFLVPPDTYTHLRSDGISALFYFANWHFIAINSNYFVQTGLASPLTHTWSLAVEEQFYLVWPLIVLGVFKVWRSTRVLLVVCLVGAVASALDMGLLYSSSNVDRVYYGTDTRAQSLLIGAALAVALSMWADRRRQSGPRSTSTAGPVGGWAAIRPGRPGPTGAAVSCWPSAWPGWRAAWCCGPPSPTTTRWPSGGASSWPPWPRRRCCSAWSAHSARSWPSPCPSPPCATSGRISYGLYLWHYPLFLYIDNARTGLTGYPLFAVRVAATLVIATASFYLVERPIRQRNFLKGWQGWVATPVAAVAVVVALFAATTTPSLAAGPTPPAGAGRSGQDAGAPVRVLLVGDSTALTLGIGLSEHQQEYDVDLLDGGILGCGVTDGAQFQLQGVDAPMATQCGVGPPSTLWPRIWQRDIARQKPDVVMILAGRWEVANRTYKGRWTNIDDPVYRAYVKAQLRYAVRVAGSGGAHVVLMTAPCYDSGEQPNGDPWPEDSRSRLAIYNGLVREVAATSPDTSVLNFNALACPGGQYQEYMDGIQVRQSDGVHFTFGGGDVFASRIWPAMVALGRQQMARADGR